MTGCERNKNLTYLEERSILLFHKASGEFLLYYNEEWQCYLFPNCNDTQLSYLKGNNGGLFHLKWLFTKHHRKETTIYHDTFYECLLNDTPGFLFYDLLEHPERDYKWMTLDQMAHDPKISRINSEMLELMKEHEEEING